MPDSSNNLDGSGEAPDTGDRAQAAGWFVMAAMGLGGAVLAGRQRWFNSGGTVLQSLSCCLN